MRRPPAWVMAFALGVALVVAWTSRSDFAYWSSAREPVDLGKFGSYQLDRLRHNQFVRVSGALGPPAKRTLLLGDATEIRALVSTNVFVERPWEQGSPELLPFQAEGRLLDAESRREYAGVVAAFRGRGWVSEGRRMWIVVHGERPRAGFGVPLAGLAVLAFALLNAAGLAMEIREWRSRSTTP